MLSCREIVKLVVNGEKIPLRKQMQLKLHLSFCKHCKAYAAQLKNMNLYYKKMFKKIIKENLDVENIKKLEKKIINDVKNIHGEKEK